MGLLERKIPLWSQSCWWTLSRVPPCTVHINAFFPIFCLPSFKNWSKYIYIQLFKMMNLFVVFLISCKMLLLQIFLWSTSCWWTISRVPPCTVHINAFLPIFCLLKLENWPNFWQESNQKIKQIEHELNNWELNQKDIVRTKNWKNTSLCSTKLCFEMKSTKLY